MASNELSIHVQPDDHGDDDRHLRTSAGADVPLSPTSIKNYKKNRVHATSETDEEANSNEDDEEEDEGEEAEYNTSHLDPRLEALDGTTKYQEKVKSDQEKEAEDEEEGEGDDDEESDESPPEPLDRDEQIADEMEALTIDDGELSKATTGEEERQDSTKLAVPGGRPPSVVDRSAAVGNDSTTFTSSEESQEPAKPHIAVPCLIETATNPPRTRITLRYVGQPPSSSGSSSVSKAAPVVKVDILTSTSTRGARVHMVATDLSGESWYATEWAITTMLRSGDELNVVTIVEDDKDAKGYHKGLRTEMREDAEKLTKNIHDQLEHTRLRDITVIIHIIAATKSHGAKELLIEMIDDIDDLSTVVVGSRGRGAIKGLLLGSISNFLVHNSPVPVMVVRAPKHKGKKKKKGKKGKQADHTKSVREANKRYEAAMSSEDDL